MRVRGRSEPLPPSYTRCARSISMSWPFNEGIHLEKLTLRKPAALEPSAPSGSPTSRKLFLLLLFSISVIFSVSRSRWFLKSVTALLSSRAAAWTESTRSRVCFAVVAIASSSSLSSLTDLLVACMSSRSSRNAGISTESIASLTAEFTTEFKVLCCSLSASLMLLAIASSRSSLEMVESLIFFLLFLLCWMVYGARCAVREGGVMSRLWTCFFRVLPLSLFLSFLIWLCSCSCLVNSLFHAPEFLYHLVSSFVFSFTNTLSFPLVFVRATLLLVFVYPTFWFILKV